MRNGVVCLRSLNHRCSAGVFVAAYDLFRIRIFMTAYVSKRRNLISLYIRIIC